MTHLEALRAKKRNMEPMTRLEKLLVDLYYINQNNPFFDMTVLEKAAEDLAALYAMRKESEKE